MLMPSRAHGWPPRCAGAVALVALLTLAAACGSTVESGNGGSSSTSSSSSSSSSSSTSTSSGSTASCPAGMPADGAVCAGDPGECHYPVQCCADTVATCTSGHWSVVPGPCVGGPEPVCGPTPPADGDACVSGCTLTACSWGTCPGSSGPAVTATCIGDKWEVSTSCALPGAGEACGQSAGGAMCGPGLACCYPCGIPDCTWTCKTPCAPSEPGCFDGCYLYP